MLRRTGFAVFGYREYRLFWIAAAFSNVGMWTLVYGRLWLMRSLTDSEILLGSVTAATMAPVMVFSVWGGVVADTVNRLRLLRFTRFLFAIAGLVTAVLIATDIIEAWHLLAISAVTGVMLAFDIPTRGAMVASLVPRAQLPSAIALYSIVFGGAAILGPSLFHPLVSAVGMEGLFFIVSASYILTVLTLMLMDDTRHITGHMKRDDDGDAPASLSAAVRARVDDMVEGVKYVRKESAIAAIIGYGIIIGIVATPLETLLPVVTQEVYLGDSATYGRFLLALGDRRSYRHFHDRFHRSPIETAFVSRDWRRFGWSVLRRVRCRRHLHVRAHHRRCGRWSVGRERNDEHNGGSDVDNGQVSRSRDEPDELHMGSAGVGRIAHGHAGSTVGRPVCFRGCRGDGDRDDVGCLAVGIEKIEVSGYCLDCDLGIFVRLTFF